MTIALFAVMRASLWVAAADVALDASVVGARTAFFRLLLEEDPAVFTQPWRLAFPQLRDDQYRIYEYACHEDNHAVEGVLRGVRYQERVKRGGR